MNAPLFTTPGSTQKLRLVYAKNADALIASSQVVATILPPGSGK